MKRLLWVTCMLVLCLFRSATVWAQGPMPMLEPEPAGEFVEAVYSISYDKSAERVLTIRHPGATFIKVRLRSLHLMTGDYITVGQSDGSQVHTYPGSGFTTDPEGAVWALSVIGDTAVVELHDGDDELRVDNIDAYDVADKGISLASSGVIIDGYTWGYGQKRMSVPESTCGDLDRRDVACYAGSHPTELGKAAAVARLTLNNGGALCTAWRVGPGGKMFTNNHCVESQSALDQMEVWFNYQRPQCDNGEVLPPVIVPAGQLLATNYELDFSLFEVGQQWWPDIEPFGYFELDPRLPAVGEQIYFPQHGAGDPKQFGIESDLDGGVCLVKAVNLSGMTSAATDAGYWCDSTGGSSGSPIVASASHRVIALHHFGTGGAICSDTVMNQGVQIVAIWPLVEEYFVDNFWISGTPSSLAVCKGGLAEYQLAVDSNYMVSVNLEVVSGAPQGAVVSIQPESLEPPGVSTLTVETEAVQPGAYQLEVVGTGGSLAKSIEFGLSVDSGMPVPPVLSSPANGAIGQVVQPRFVWAGGNAGHYLVEVARDAEFADVVASQLVSGWPWTPTQVLEYGTEYFWRVTAINACYQTTSSVQSFRTNLAPGLCPVWSEPVVLYETDFEDDTNQWILEGHWVASMSNHSSPTTSMWSDDVVSISDQRLVSPEIRLPITDTTVWLQFDNWRDIEGFPGTGTCYDGALVEANVDVDGQWEQLFPFNDAYPGIVADGFGNPLADHWAWCGFQPWTLTIFDVSAYIGEDLQIGFRLGTDSSVGADGWYVDDVKIFTCGQPIETNTLFLPLAIR